MDDFKGKLITPEKQIESKQSDIVASISSTLSADEIKKQKKIDSARRLKEKLEAVEAQTFDNKVIKPMLENGLLAFDKKVSHNHEVEELKKSASKGELNNQNSEPKLTYYFFMRHGERADFFFRKVKPEEHQNHPNAPPYKNSISHDPPLTANGLKQAYSTGLYLKERLTYVEEIFKLKFDEVIIESSPWVRTL